MHAKNLAYKVFTQLIKVIVLTLYMELLEALQAVVCVFKGHKVKRDCQIELKKSATGIYETQCDRCKFPLILQMNESDNKRYFVTEADSLELLTKSDTEKV
jgi:hypothetical protein